MLAQPQPSAHEERARGGAMARAQLQQQRALLFDLNLAAVHPRPALRPRLLRLRLR